MFLSKITLNMRNHGVCSDINNMYAMHQTLISMLPDFDNTPDTKYLYRLEQNERPNSSIILMQSQSEPNFGRHLETGYIQIAQSKEYSPNFTDGDKMRFRLYANAVRKRTYDPDKDTMPGKKSVESVLVPMYKEAEMEAWILERLPKMGLELINIEQMIKSYRNARKPKTGSMNLYAVQYDCIVKIADANIAAETVRSGYGKAKAFGFGLISLAKI